MAVKKKIAVVIFNLGGPDSAAAIEPFLKNFFTDPNIIRLPYPLRWFIARLIAHRRSRKEAGESYGMIGGRSPLLENTRAQANALERALTDSEEADYQVFVAMRYWHPMAEEVAKEVKAYGPDEIICLPLYPQYSTTTTRSSWQTWQKAASKEGIDVPTSLICCYPDSDPFVDASVSLIKPVWEEAVKLAKAQGTAVPRLLLSAHGLPESVIKDGDPYQWQCKQTAAAIVKKLGISDNQWILCYQSRVGPKKWLEPDTANEITRAGAESTPVVVYPLAFVNEHVETLVEIEEEYRLQAKEDGVPAFYRVETVGTNGVFIDGLTQMVKKRAGKATVAGESDKRICPVEFRRCCMEQFGITGE